MTANKGVSLFILLCITTRALSLTCLECIPADCRHPSTLGCTAGFVDDVCGCCPTCAKALGEDCKGPFGSAGICAVGLDCYLDEAKLAQIPGALFNAAGICAPPGCDENLEPLFCAFDLVPQCGSNGVTYQSSCDFASAKCKLPGLESIPCDLPPVRDACDINGEPTSCGYDLVLRCGSNGQTYQGSCEFASAKCKNPQLEEIPCRSLPEPTCSAPGSECAGGFCKDRCDYDNGEYNAPFNSCGGRDKGCTCCASQATSQCFGRGNPCEAVVGGTCRDQCEFDEVEQGFCTARVADVAQCVCCRKQSSNPREFTLDGEAFIVLSQHKGSTWQQAQNHCAREGNYKLAEPQLDVTRLASYLNTNYGAELYWLGGKGQGFRISYLSGEVIPTNSPLWRFNAADGLQRSNNFCMYIRDNGNPNPLGTYNCQDTQYMTPLCERTGNVAPPPPPPPAAPAISFPGK